MNIYRNIRKSVYSKSLCIDRIHCEIIKTISSISGKKTQKQTYLHSSIK